MEDQVVSLTLYTRVQNFHSHYRCHCSHRSRQTRSRSRPLSRVWFHSHLLASILAPHCACHHLPPPAHLHNGERLSSGSLPLSISLPECSAIANQSSRRKARVKSARQVRSRGDLKATADLLSCPSARHPPHLTLTYFHSLSLLFYLLFIPTRAALTAKHCKQTISREIHCFRKFRLAVIQSINCS